jgi:deoxyribonuclease V
MNAILDVHYRDRVAIAGCLISKRWTDDKPHEMLMQIFPDPLEYEPGQFYKRELPCLLGILDKAKQEFETIVIDGFVHLKPPIFRGLGLYLADSLTYEPVIIGVAKNPLKMADKFVPVYRGQSKKPLFISAVN